MAVVQWDILEQRVIMVSTPANKFINVNKITSNNVITGTGYVSDGYGLPWYDRGV